MAVQRKRHIAKAFSWRLVASMATFFIGWIATGDMTIGFTIGAADVVIKLVLYYFHERIWYRSHFGVIHSADDESVKID